MSVGDTHGQSNDEDAAIEMDALSGSAMRQERSRSRAKSIAPGLAKETLNKKDYAIGIGLLLIVVLLWTSSNFITQDLFEGGYAKPFLVTYLNTASFSLYLLPFGLKKLWRYYRGSKDLHERTVSTAEYEPLVNDAEAVDENDAPSHRRHSSLASHKSGSSVQLEPLSLKETAQLAFIFCLFWFIANWSVNASLDFTSVASTTILSSMSGFFTLGFGRLFRVEPLTIGKVGAVFTSFAGVILVSLSDSTESKPHPAPRAPPVKVNATSHAPRPLLGDMLALLSAVFYALYVILLKVRIRSESRINMQLFFGFVGLFNILLLWPIIIILHFTGAEKFELPTTRGAVAAIVVNMFITLSSDFIYVLAMLKTTPLVVTIGLSLTIPVAVLGDFLLGRPSRLKVILGASLVLLSFVAVGWEDSRRDDGSDDLSEDSRLFDGRGRQTARGDVDEGPASS